MSTFREPCPECARKDEQIVHGAGRIQRYSTDLADRDLRARKAEENLRVAAEIISEVLPLFKDGTHLSPGWVRSAAVSQLDLDAWVRNFERVRRAAFDIPEDSQPPIPGHMLGLAMAAGRAAAAAAPSV